MSYRVFTSVAVLCAVFLLTSARNGYSADTAKEPVASEPVVRPEPLAMGETAPDFSLLRPDKTPLHLAQQLEAGPVVLVVLRGWPGYQCPICTRQVGEFIGKAAAIKAAGAHVVLVYPGPGELLTEHSLEFIGKTTLPDNFSFLIDPDFGFTNLYGLRWDAPRETAYPSTYVIGGQRKVKFARVSKTHGGRAKVADVLSALNDPK